MTKLLHNIPLLNNLYDKFLELPLAQKVATTVTLFSTGCMLVLILANHQGQLQLIGESGELFGDSLVKQLSRDASAPLVQGDRLSLQSLLNELVASPLIARGAIYDVENHPIAEAGELLDGKDISASITFQDSIAGYAVVTFDTQALQQQAAMQSWQSVGLCVLLAALAFTLALYPGRQLSAIIRDLAIVATTPYKYRKANMQVAYHGDDELWELSRALLDGPTQTNNPSLARDFAMLTIEITNLPSLQVNLGQQALASALQALHQELTTICRLYDGELSASRSHCFSAQFSASDDAENYAFRAVCSAFLIEQVMDDEDLPFHIRQVIATNDSALSRLEPLTGKQTTIEKSLLLASASRDGIVLSENVYLHPSVENRVEAISLGDGAYQAEQLDAAYQQLLERQFNTLRQQ